MLSRKDQKVKGQYRAATIFDREPTDIFDVCTRVWESESLSRDLPGGMP